MGRTPYQWFPIKAPMTKQFSSLRPVFFYWGCWLNISTAFTKKKRAFYMYKGEVGYILKWFIVSTMKLLCSFDPVLMMTHDFGWLNKIWADVVVAMEWWWIHMPKIMNHLWHVSDWSIDSRLNNRIVVPFWPCADPWFWPPHQNFGQSLWLQQSFYNMDC